jgi:DNA polymerase
MNTGFFSTKQTQSDLRPDGKTYSCASCGLYRNAVNPKMKPFGNFKKGILNIGEAPGKSEDEKSKQWQGKTGRLLQRTYEKLGIDLFEDCLNINAVNCRPIENDNNRTPTNHEITCCRNVIVSKLIKEYQPSIIILLGGNAVYSVIGHRWMRDLGGISKWRGWTIPDKDYKAWICPVFHPSFVEHSEGSEVQLIWEQDLQRIFELIKEPLPKYREPRIEIIDDLSVLNKIERGMITFDYETTGLKPQAVGQRIVSCAVAVNENHAYSFLIPETRRERQPLVDLLANDNIEKIAHNMKFEQGWSVVRLKQSVENWVWDSMQAAHLLDNRPGITGLKFQAFVNFGVVDYSSEIDPYLKAENANGINKIEKLISTPSGKEKLLTYGGLDAVYEYRLAIKQMKTMNYDPLPF